MADKLQQTISAFLTFVDGERPSAAKFNALIAQIRGATRTYEYAIGDILSQNWPYTTNPPNESFTYLTIPYGRRKNADLKVNNATSGGRPLDIINLARIIGPAGNLNPTSIGGERLIREELIPTGGTQYSLRYPPLAGEFSQDANNYFSTNEADLEVEDYFLGPPQDNKSLIVKRGDWYHEDGILYWWGVKNGGIPSGMRVSYRTNPTSYAGGPNYQGASFNTIPDWHQVVQAGAGAPKLIIDGDGQINDGKYLVQLPVVSHQQLNYDHTTTTLTDELDLNSGKQLTLPKYLTDNFTIGEVIPAGLIVLKCFETNEVFREAVYIYDSPTTLYIDNIELCDMSDPQSGAQIDRTYYLVTAGTDITTSIDDLRNKLSKHSHNREFGEPLVSIWDIDEINKYQSVSGYYAPSRIEGDFASQYLHKDGWRADHGFIAPAALPVMRGSLVLGLKDVQGYNIKTSTRDEGEGEYSSVEDPSHSGLIATYISNTSYSGHKPQHWNPDQQWIGESNRIVFGGLPNDSENLKDGSITSQVLPSGVDWRDDSNLSLIIHRLLSRIGRGTIPFRPTLNTSGPQIYRYKEHLSSTNTFDPNTWLFKGAVEVFPIGSSGRITHCLLSNSDASSATSLTEITPEGNDKSNFLDYNLLDKQWLYSEQEQESDPQWTNKSFWNGALRIEGQKGYPIQIFGDAELRLDNTTYADTEETYWVPKNPGLAEPVYSPTPPSRGKDIVLKSLDYIKMSANLAVKCYARTNINFSAAGLVGAVGDDGEPEFHPDAGNFTATARHNIALQSGNNLILQTTGDTINKWDVYHNGDENAELSCNEASDSALGFEQRFIGGDVGVHAWKDVCISAGSVGVEFNENTIGEPLYPPGNSGGDSETPPFRRNLAADEENILNQQAGSLCLTARNPSSILGDPPNWRKRYKGINILAQGPHEPRNAGNRIVIRTGPHAFKGTADLVGGYGYKYENLDDLFDGEGDAENIESWENPILHIAAEENKAEQYPFTAWAGAYAGEKPLSRYLDFSIHLIGHGGMGENQDGNNTSSSEMIGTSEDLLGLVDGKKSYSSAGTLIMSSFWAKDSGSEDAEAFNEPPPWGPTMPHSDDYNNFLAVTTNGICDGWSSPSETSMLHKHTAGLESYQNLVKTPGGDWKVWDPGMDDPEGISWPSTLHTQRAASTKLIDAGIPCRSFWFGGWDFNHGRDPQDVFHSQSDADEAGYTVTWLNDLAGRTSAGSTKPKRAELWVRNRSLNHDEWTAVFDNSYGYNRNLPNGEHGGVGGALTIRKQIEGPQAFYDRKFGRWKPEDYAWSGIEGPVSDAWKVNDDDEKHVGYIPAMHFIAGPYRNSNADGTGGLWGTNGAGRGVLIGAPNLMDVECAHVRYTWLCFRAANRSVGKIQSKGAYEKELALITSKIIVPTNPIWAENENGEPLIDDDGEPVQAVDGEGEPLWELDGNGDPIGIEEELEVPSHKVDWISFPDQYNVKNTTQVTGNRKFPQNYTYTQSLYQYGDELELSNQRPPVDGHWKANSSSQTMWSRFTSTPDMVNEDDRRPELQQTARPNRFTNAQVLLNFFEMAHGEWAVGQYSETCSHVGVSWDSFPFDDGDNQRLDKLKFLYKDIMGIPDPTKDQISNFIQTSEDFMGYWSRSMISDYLAEYGPYQDVRGPYIIQHGHYGGGWDPDNTCPKKKKSWWKTLVTIAVAIVVAVAIGAMTGGLGALAAFSIAGGGWAGLGAAYVWGGVLGGAGAIGGGIGAGFLVDSVWADLEQCQKWDITTIENVPTNNVLACKGDVAYVSGAADYAEYIQIGEPEEWALDKDPNMFNWDSGKSEDSPSFGLPEGLLVWIKEGKIWKYPDTGNETPMIITNRAAVVGNARAEFSGTPYELVSFIGQVPVRVTGNVKSGDLLVPSKNGRDVFGITKEECDFKDYKKAIGTCWETMSGQKNTVLCAIGIK